MNDNLSPADIKAVVGDNNSYPVFPYGAGFGNGFGNNGDWLWIIILLFMFGGWGNGNGGYGFNNDYAWLSNGQKEIMQNTTEGFNTLHLSNQVEGVRDGINSLATQLCNSTANINQTVSGGFADAEISANARQMANMQQSFNNQIATLQGFNDVTSQLASCCCENRLASCQTQNAIQNEGNATRFADANNTRDIIESQNRNSQAILDKLCQLELDGIKAQLEAKNDLIGQLRQENLYARGQASQLAQTEAIKEGIYAELKNCPIGTVPVFRKSADFFL